MNFVWHPTSFMVGAGWPLGREGGLFVAALGPMRWVFHFRRKRENDERPDPFVDEPTFRELVRLGKVHRQGFHPCATRKQIEHVVRNLTNPKCTCNELTRGAACVGT